jgi:hypothetical protein
MTIGPARVATSEADRKAAMKEDWNNLHKAYNDLTPKDNYDQLIADPKSKAGKYKMMKAENVHVGYIVKAQRLVVPQFRSTTDPTMVYTSAYYKTDGTLIGQIIHSNQALFLSVDMLVQAEDSIWDTIYHSTGGILGNRTYRY